MKSNVQEIMGALISTIGTIQAAIGSTPDFGLSQKQNFQSRLIGNVFQAIGSGLSADGQGTFSLEKIGDQIQSTGNSTVISGMLLFSTSDKDSEQRLIIAGLWLQALGSFVGLSDEFFDRTEDGRMEIIIGGMLQGIGNSLQAIGGIQTLYDYNSEHNQNVVVGSWVQATGSVISLVGQIQEELQEKQIYINE
ncbi:hypothetical protein ABE096_13765 [Robertmurraya massiliosenegalensis]|uniref:DUF6944 family repetitive protein n=1 Tax=Robertmurraya TaxID=2837507 RepID=UPI0039A45B65